MSSGPYPKTADDYDGDPGPPRSREQLRRAYGDAFMARIDAYADRVLGKRKDEAAKAYNPDQPRAPKGSQDGKDEGIMIDEPKCFSRQCKYFIGASDAPESEQVPICAAFPKGIPVEIAYGDNPHTEPYSGDGGVQFERAEE